MSTDLSPLTPDNELFVQQQIEAGTYEDRAEVLNVSVELLKKRRALIQQVEEARRQLERGEYTEFDDESLRKYFDGLEQRIDERVTQRQQGQ